MTTKFDEDAFDRIMTILDEAGENAEGKLRWFSSRNTDLNGEVPMMLMSKGKSAEVEWAAGVLRAVRK